MKRNESVTLTIAGPEVQACFFPHFCTKEAEAAQKEGPQSLQKILSASQGACCMQDADQGIKEQGDSPEES